MKFKDLKICHLADIQIRKGIRHEEYRQVFERTYKDIINEKPLRILLAGDIFHNKIDMSPNLINLASDFFTNLSKIAPVDIIPGNHDLNLSQLSQGDGLKSIVSLLHNGVIVTNENKDETSFSKKYDDKFGIFYFPESGFFEIGNDIIYGHYSCIDAGILSLKKKDKESDKKYIALFHGQVYQSMNDNGSLNLDQSLIKTSAFDNFDIVIMGDIHEHQSFREDKSMCYCGSLIQQSYGESIRKGYVTWDLETNSFRFKYIPNDYGFAKIRLSQGENWEERINNMQFSNEKKKTKVYIEWQDFEENYSVEKENQLIKYVKDKHGCDLVTIDFKQVFKDNILNEEEKEADVIMEKNILELIREYLEENDNNFNVDNEFTEELLELVKRIDRDLEIKENVQYSNSHWHIKTVEVSNLFSYGVEPIFFDFDKLSGLTGIFGENYSGKTNFIKSIVWGLFQYILGGGESKSLVNIYTGNDKAYVNIYLVINGVEYRILRSIRNYKGRDGSVKVTYEVAYQLYQEDSKTGKKSWVDEINDKKTNDKKAVKDLIIESIGTPSDFCKVNLQSENGKDNYLNSDQPGKNDVMSKYLGLQSYQDRYDYAKKIFNEITKDQKRLGDVNLIQSEIKSLNDKIYNDNINLHKLEKEKKEKQLIIDSINDKIIELSSLLEKVEILRENNVDLVKEKIETERKYFQLEKEEYVDLEKWVSENFRKELSEVVSEKRETLENYIEDKNLEFNDINNKIDVGNDWISKNPKKKEGNIQDLQDKILSKKEELIKLTNHLPSCRGEKCPTCGSEKKKADPEKEKEILNKISILEGEVNSLNTKVKMEREIVDHNNKYDKAILKIESLKNSLPSITIEINEYKRKIDVIEKSKDAIEHNLIYDQKQDRFKKVRSSLENRKKNIDEYKELITKIEQNKDKVGKNKITETLIEKERESLKDEKIYYQNIDRQTTNIYAELRVSQRNLDVLEEKIKAVQKQEREYKLYSIYLQCVHKDGIPAQIIKRKLPIVNSKIRSILKDLVEYKIELWLDKKGDIKETFFYNDDKSDSLPMDSSSGAQGFLANLAIRDALHYVSKLPKSSMCIIDEGFGKLDAEKMMNMQQPLQYLKNKYKNVFVVTHADVIKEFMDQVISVSKSKKGIPTEYQEKYDQAWTTQVSFS